MPDATPTPSSGNAPVSVKVDIPGQALPSSLQSRQPQFVDLANGAQLVVTLVSVNASPVHSTVSYALATSGTPALCTSSTPPVCTLSVILPAGQDLLQITEEDGKNRALAQNEVASDIVPGTANTIYVTLNAIVASLSAPSCGAAAFQNDGQHLSVTLSAQDAAGFTIAPPGLYGAAAGGDGAVLLNPLTLSSTDQRASFSVNAGPATNPATLSGPGDKVTLIYNGPAPSAGTTVPVTLSATLSNGLPGAAPIAPVTASCTLSQNSTYSADPETTFSNVGDTAFWQVPAAANPFTAGCSPQETLCYYPITGGSFGPVTTGSAGAFNLTYSGYALLRYADTGYTAFTIQSIVLSFVDEANVANTFVASVSASSASYANSAGASPATINTASPTVTFSVNGGTGVFAGVSGSFNSPFTLTPDGPTLSLYKSTGDSGTLQGI